MGAMNKKQVSINYENSIKKSNEISMGKLSHGLSLNQMQLLAYAIYCTQQNGKTEFHKADFEKKFNLGEYRTNYIKNDIDVLDIAVIHLIKIDNLEEEFIKRKSIKIFDEIEYNKGLFSFEWEKRILPHIIDLKEKFVLTDLSITAKFKSGFSWILYDFIRGLYGHWYKPISKESLMELFGVEDKKTYQTHTGVFKQMVLDVAMKEINEHTELKLWYEEEKQGRKITGFILKWSTGEKVDSVTKSQLKELKAMTSVILDNIDTYTSVKNKDNRLRAYELIRESEKIKIKISESITKKYANELIERLKTVMIELNNIQKKDNGRDTSFYYDWLEEK